jgi:hypothetical protein
MNRILRVALVLAFAPFTALADAEKKEAPKDPPKAAPKEQPAEKKADEWKVGDAVDVEWSREWHQGVITAVKGDGNYRIRYVGWGDWEEDVYKNRLRARTAESKRGHKKE